MAGLGWGLGVAEIFISYARDEQASARRVANALADAGFDVWWDAHLPAHKSYSEVIEQALAEAKAVVVLWSARAAQSQWVRAEADFARSHGKLVQAQLDSSLPPMPFNQIQCANLKGWRGAQGNPGWLKLKASVAALAAEDGASVLPDRPARSGAPFGKQAWWVSAAIVGVLAIAALWLFFPRAGADAKPVLAILPFESVGDANKALAEGMWDDTRQAIGRNPQLVVLGPHTVEQIAAQGPAATRKMAGYVLEANVRSAGDRIRVNANLVRTADGVQIWSESFDRRMSDVFALQADLAQAIEGRIRGRLAKSGGTRAEHIETTADVYALYNDARAKIRKRDIYQGYGRALAELRQVVKLDPNFAPGWATLAVAEVLNPPVFREKSTRQAAEGHARQAIALAPNLAAGHSALALALSLNGPVAEAEIRRAIALDPNDPEAFVWLGNIYQIRDNRSREALDAYSRAVAIEPLWWPAVLNQVGALLDAGNVAAANQELQRVRQLGDRQLAATIEMTIANASGNHAAAIRIGLDYLRSSPRSETGVLTQQLWSLLLQLGYDDEAWKISPAPPFGPLLRTNDARGIAMVDDLHLTPEQLFSTSPLQTNYARALIVNRRGGKLVEDYTALQASPEQLEAMAGRDEYFLFAPLLAIALKDAGKTDDATAVLDRARDSAQAAFGRLEPTQAAILARILAVEGNRDQALRMLARAVQDDWIPDPPELLTDIAADPAFRDLRADPRFNPLRLHILQTVDRERRKLGAIDVSEISRGDR